MSYTYIASPYSSGIIGMQQIRFEAVAHFVAQLIRAGEMPYSPIVHCHQLSIDFEFASHYDYWQRYNRAMLSKASKMIVLMLDGWKESKGVQAEIEFAELCGIPVEYVTWKI